MNDVVSGSVAIPAESVREIATSDGAILLDLEGRKCIALTPVAFKIWTLTKSHLSCAEIAEKLAAEFNVPLQEVQDDTREFLQGLASAGLLSLTRTAQTRSFLLRLALLLRRACLASQNLPRGSTDKMRSPIMKALFALLALDILHVSQDFSAMCELVRGWQKAPRTANPDAVRRICRAVAYACIWYPKRVLCLQRSAVMTCLLRERGVPAEMVMGAQIIPFKAHAWTEVGGRPIDESKDVQKIYLIWDRC